jgi:hypothetical protein
MQYKSCRGVYLREKQSNKSVLGLIVKAKVKYKIQKDRDDVILSSQQKN